MRIISAIFFIFTFPLIVIIATILFGGITKSSVKQALLQANAYEVVYNKLSRQFDESSKDSQDATVNAIVTAAKNRITPLYLRTKTEKAIDDTVAWMNGKSKVPPVISFPEIKEDIDAQSPLILPSLLKDMNEFKKEQQTALREQNPDGSMQAPEFNSIGTFIQNGFTIPLGNTLVFLKQLHLQLLVVFIVLSFLLTLSVFLMYLFSKPMRQKFIFIGIIFLITACYGYALTYSTSTLTSILEAVLKSQGNQAVVYVTPIIIRLASTFLLKYKDIQTSASILLLVLGVAFLMVSVFIGNRKNPAGKS